MQHIISDLTKLIIEISSHFVTVPEKLDINVSRVGEITDIRIIPDDSDVGRIIGVRGCRWKAFSAICYAVSLKHNMRIELLKVCEPLGDRKTFYPPFVAQEDWPIEEVRGLAKNMAQICFDNEDAIEVEIVDEKDQSTIFIHVSGAERHSAVRALALPFNTLLDAVGLAMGRKIRTSIVADVVAQPDSAAGRSTEEINRS